MDNVIFNIALKQLHRHKVMWQYMLLGALALRVGALPATLPLHAKESDEAPLIAQLDESFSSAAPSSPIPAEAGSTALALIPLAT